ncbi:MAG: hypothetical protein JO258_10220 [Alphaproteobacteria bacterium]|nr:hypothetical protein [Alphaproteobacteria bacterium]
MIDRRLVLALPLLPALGGCGWEPIYANRQTAAADAALQSIAVTPIAERIGQRLEMALRNSLNPNGAPAQPKYLLRVTMATATADLGIQSQGLGTRGDVSVAATYQLSDAATRAIVQTGSMHTSESFDIQANGYSTVVAQDDAFVRAVEQIRGEIVTRLTLFLQKKAAVAS